MNTSFVGDDHQAEDQVMLVYLVALMVFGALIVFGAVYY